MNKKLIVMSSGGNLVRYKEQLKKLKDNDDFEVLCFSHSFSFCVNELGFYPDYFTVLDPWPFMLPWALERLTKVTEKIKTKVIVLDPLHTKHSYKQYINWYGTTPLGRPETPGGNHGGFDRLHKLVNKLEKSDKVEVMKLPCFTLKHIYENKLLYPMFKTNGGFLDLVGNNFENRFDVDEVIIKNQLNPTLNEDKLTSYILPVLQKLGKKEVYLIGWDCMGGRYLSKKDIYASYRYPEKATADAAKTDFFLSPNANRGLEEAKETIRRFLPRWNQYVKCTNLVEDKYTYLNKFIDYKPIEEVIK